MPPGVAGMEPAASPEPTATPPAALTLTVWHSWGTEEEAVLRDLTAAIAELADAESVSYSSTISRSSIARSLIDCTRWSGLLARQRRMSRRSSAGTAAFSSSTGTGFSLRILCIVSMPVSAAKGFRRVAAS